jgi:hypothetical protein
MEGFVGRVLRHFITSHNLLRTEMWRSAKAEVIRCIGGVQGSEDGPVGEGHNGGSLCIRS